MNDFPQYLESISKTPIYVILGVQGSGTNLLSRFLRSIFRFSVVHDRCLILDAGIRIHRKPTPAQIARQLNTVHRALFPGTLGRRLDMMHFHHQQANYVGIERHLENVPVRSATDFLDFYYGYHAFTNGGSHRAVKSDDLWARMPYAETLFPQRRYILLVRDFRDNAMSIRAKPFGPQNIYAASIYVKDRFQVYRAEAEKHPELSFTTTYETLLTEPKRFVSDFSARFEMEPAADVDRAIEDLAIRSGNRDKWKQLSPRQLAVAEAVLKDELNQFGYETAGDRRQDLTTWQRVRWRAGDYARRVPQKIRWVVNTFAKR